MRTHGRAPTGAVSENKSQPPIQADLAKQDVRSQGGRSSFESTIFISDRGIDVPLEAISNRPKHLGELRSAEPTREVIDVYFDTAERDLFRFGIVVYRHLDGEDLSWSIDLYEDNDLEPRHSHRIAVRSTRTVVPESLLKLLFPILHSRTLIPVAEVRSTRKLWNICESSGALLEKIGTAFIHVRGDSEPTNTISVAEISNTRNEPGRRLARRTRRVLSDCGFQQSKASPPILTMIMPISVSPHPNLPNDLVKGALAQSLLRLLSFDFQTRISDDPEVVHQLRVAIRHLRSDLRSFPSRGGEHREDDLRRDLAWIGEVIGACRDSDVLAEHIQALASRCALEDARDLQKVMSILEAEGGLHRQKMHTAINTSRYGGLIDDLIAFTDALPDDNADTSKSTTVSHKRARKILRRQWNKFESSAKFVSRSSTDLDMHRCRILAKRSRYATEAAVPMFGRNAELLAHSLSDVQDLLGSYHDCVVAERWVREMTKAHPDTNFVAGEIIGFIRQERERIHQEWPGLWKRVSAPKLRQWL